MSAPRDPAADLRRIAFLLERSREATYRVRAFRTAAAALQGRDDIEQRAAAGTLTALKGVGEATARCITESVSGQQPGYLSRLETTATIALEGEGGAVRAALRGDCHTHSDWSDGGSPIEEMAAAGREIGHDYLVLTDHSPRLTVANGLSADRLRRQLDVVASINDGLAPFRILTGIEVDILPDGTLDQLPELLARLDLVVASVHSRLRMPRAEMTARMLAAVGDPNVDVLGHCTGRMVTGSRARPESQFDADAVFAACAEQGVAVEINSRPERLDPPRRLLRSAVAGGCLVWIESGAHAPGQLDWLGYGCERAAECGADLGRIVNTWRPDDLLAWTADHTRRP